jgi:hypothetical protein
MPSLPVADWRDQEAQDALAQRSYLPMVGQAIGRNLIDNTIQYDNNGLPVLSPVPDVVPTVDDRPSSERKGLSKAIDKLLGLGGEERYQLWPERVVKEGISAPHDVMSSKVPLTSEDLIAPAMSMSALAGSGGIAGAGEEAGAATLGSAPFLRPALKYEGKIYKGPVGGEHYDAIPKELHSTFQKQAMSGEDLSNFNFGFTNHKGHFLSREDALKYAIDEGLIHPNSEAARAGTLTSTMQLEGAKPKLSAGDFVPAIRDPKTNEIVSGNDHVSLLSKLDPERFKRIYNSNEGQGFVDKQGNFLSRSQFNDKFGISSSMDLPSTMQLAADSSKPGTAIEAAKPLNIYRGEYSGNKGGKFWTEDREFAKQFTQSGLDKEILQKTINPSDIHDAIHVYAGDPDAVDKVIAIARSNGKKAVRLNEGQGEPNSLYVFNKTGLK